MAKLLTKEEAVLMINTKWEPELRTETVSINECYGRVAAEDVYAKYNIPVVRSSAFDGIAVRSAVFYDEAAGLALTPDTGSWKPGVDYVRADTGDDFDDAFDAVIPIEMVSIMEDGSVELDLNEDLHPGKVDGFAVRKGVNVRPAGSSLKEGTLLLARGTRIRPEDIACLGLSGTAEVKVYKKPVVAFIPTGSELIEAGGKLERGQNFNSNGPMVKALLEQAGAEPLIMPIVKDKKQELRDALREALSKADIVVINGGSSKGEEDFNTTLLDEMGELLFHGVRAVPGKPMGVSIIDGKPVVNTSGPALASYYGINWCVLELVSRMLGLGSRTVLKRRVRLAEDISSPGKMSVQIRLNVEETEDGPVARNVEGGKANMVGSLRANATFMSVIGKSDYPAGSIIEVEMRLV